MAMPHHNPGGTGARAYGRKPAGLASRPLAAFAAAIGLAFAGAGFARWGLPQPLVIPLTVSLLLAGAAAVGVWAWSMRCTRNGEGLTYWDVAGALTFIGVGLSALIEPNHVVTLLEGMQGQERR
ncbi:MAG: hypothetical protein J0H62_03595 [Rhizobiales bacterium]|nr:hypothetical protein [Hyphomicrobiales bacterium]